MADFVRVANRNDIPAGEARMFEVNGRQVAVFHTAGGFQDWGRS
jgi:hypothetical protein